MGSDQPREHSADGDVVPGEKAGRRATSDASGAPGATPMPGDIPMPDASSLPDAVTDDAVAGDAVIDDVPDPAAGLRVIAEQGRAMRAATEPDVRVLFGAWGGAWLVGYLAMYADYRSSGGAGPVGGAVFGAGLTIAVVITAVHISRRSAGMRGASARQGTFYGLAWVLSFALVFAALTSLARLAAEIEGGSEMVGIAANAMSAAVVAAIYMVGGALWEERGIFALGAWIAIVAAVASVVGMPALYLVMAFAGGGGFLVAAMAEHLRLRRRTRIENAHGR